MTFIGVIAVVDHDGSAEAGLGKSKRHGRAEQIARNAAGPLSRAGVRNTTLGEIGAMMNMSAAHLLYYFDNKNDLFLAALRAFEDDVHTQVNEHFEQLPGARDRWRCVLGYGTPPIDDSSTLMWLEGWTLAAHDAEVHRVISELEENWQQLLTSTLRYGIERGELPEDTDVAHVVEGVSALLDGLTMRIVVGHRPIDRAAAQVIVSSFTDPLLDWRDPS